MKNLKRIFLYQLLGIGLILGSLPVVNAQESATDEFTLEEITVTAQKRVENQQKVAIAMDVISGDQMKEMGQTDINQILGNLSSATINKTGSALRIAIRGVSDDLAENSVQVTTPTAALNTDGVMTNRNQAGTGLYDVERVEVLVGPQSTLYASASPGGIVNVVTAAPKLEKFEGSATLEYGNYNLKHGEGAVNVPVSSAVALRAAVSINSRDGYNSNGGDDQEQKSARLKALFKPNDKLSLTVTGEMSKQTDHGFGTVKEFNNQGDEYYPDGVTKLTDPWTSSSDTLGQSMKKTEKKIYAKMDWDLGPFVLTLTPAYTTSTSPSDSAGIDGRSNLYTVSESSRDSSEKSMELRLASSEDFFFKWIVGAVYYKAVDESVSTSVNSAGSNFNNLSNDDTVKAFYGNITYPIIDRFRVTAGLRLAKDANNSFQNQSDGPPDLVMPVICDQTYDTPSYKIGAEYDVNETSMLYADVSTAYRTQGMGFDSKGNVFPAEELTAFNLGSKNRFFGKKLQFNASAYYYKYKNTLGINSASYLYLKTDVDGDGHYDPSDGDTVNTSADSDAKAVGDYKQYGLDLDTSAILTAYDKLDLSISLMHGEYTHLFFDYQEATNHPETWLDGAVGTPDLDYSGKQKTNSPSVSITGSYSHNFNLWNGGIITPRLDVRYKSSYILTFSEEYMDYDLTTTPPGHTIQNLREVRKQEAYYTADFTTTYADPSGKWTLTGYVKNVTNYAVKTSWTYMGGGNASLMIGPPRTFGGILSLKF
jgi:iron complex outermembrane recepter protein